jgi:hypothetical protein
LIARTFEIRLPNPEVRELFLVSTLSSVLPALQDGEGFIGAYVMLGEGDRASLLTLWRDSRPSHQELFDGARNTLSATCPDVSCSIETWATVLPAGPRGLLVREALLRG